MPTMLDEILTCRWSEIDMQSNGEPACRCTHASVAENIKTDPDLVGCVEAWCLGCVENCVLREVTAAWPQKDNPMNSSICFASNGYEPLDANGSGTIADAVIFDRCLSAEEVASLAEPNSKFNAERIN